MRGAKPDPPTAQVVKLHRAAAIVGGVVNSVMEIRNIGCAEKDKISKEEAEKYVRKEILAKLVEEQFCEPAPMPYGGPKPAQVYGVKNAEGCWYVKFTVSPNGPITVVSCHRPEHDMECTNGDVVEKGWK